MIVKFCATQAIAIRPTGQYEPNFTVVAWRTVYDIIFFIVITILGLNIVIAILVDRFSDLREEKVLVTLIDMSNLILFFRIKLMMIMNQVV